MSEAKESGVWKFVRDAVLAVLSGIVLEPTLKQIHFDVGPYLRQIWFVIAMFLTLDYISRNHLGRLIQWKRSLARGKRMMTYVFVALSSALVGCLYWLALGNVISADDEPPITKFDSFGTLVPILPSNVNVPIPMDLSSDDPHSDFYRDLLGLSGRPDKPAQGAPANHERNLLADNGMSFAARVVHYYTFYSIYRLQRGTSLGIRWTAKEGVRPVNRAPIAPPDAIPYPNNSLLKLLSASEFLRDGDKMLWKFDNNRLIVPKGSDVSFVEIPANPEKGQMMVCRIRFERPHYYRLDFDISPGLAQSTQMPAGFEPRQIPGAFTWTLQVAMRYQIERRTDDGFRPEQYSAWGDSLFDGLKKNMEF